MIPDPPGCEALVQDMEVLESLRELVGTGMTEEARMYAEGALRALIPPDAQAAQADQAALHVMMSCKLSLYTSNGRPVCSEQTARAYRRCF